jgi:hypothetical protein
MKKFQKIGFDDRGYESNIKSITTAAQIYFDAAKELRKLKVKGFRMESLTKGGFMGIFNDYQKKEYQKSKAAKELGLTYEKFLDLQELDTTKLKELEQRHEQMKDRTIDLYEYNNSFFHYAEIKKSTDARFRRALEIAPKKKSYKILKLFSISGSKVNILLSKEPFNVYALSQEQIQIMYDVADYVKASKAIGLQYNEVWPTVEKFLFDDSNLPREAQSGKRGLSRDLNEIIFGYNKILIYNI